MSEMTSISANNRTAVSAALAFLRGNVDGLGEALSGCEEPDDFLPYVNQVTAALTNLETEISNSMSATPSALPPCEVQVGEHRYWKNAEGSLIAVEAIRPADMLEDETVRKIIGYAIPLSDQISRFWQHTHADVAGFVDLVLQQYGTGRGGKKGNITLTSFDDMFKVELRVAKLIEFKSDLQAAKILTDECLAEWSDESGAEIRTIVRSAFNIDKDGKVNQQALLSLLRHNFDHPKWKLAMDAIRDAIRIRATKEYFRFFQRPAPGKDFKAITIDLAQA